MLIFDEQMFCHLCREADQSPRRRQHINLHRSHEESCQRLFNAIQPESYIAPHRHAVSNTRELLVAVQGRFALVTFKDEGDLLSVIPFGTELHLDDSCSSVGVEVPPNVWHTVLATEKNSILLEVKEGPFLPTESKELAPWAPRVGSSEAEIFLSKLQLYVRAHLRALAD